jgi:hypothetical protein
MALSLDPATKVISVPQADLTFVSGTLYTLDSDQFRKDVMGLLASENYIWMVDAFIHNTEVTVAGTTFARTLEFINGYSITFENTGSAYSVRIEGSNNNIFDIENGIINPTPLVTVISTNSAGLIRSETSIAQADLDNIADAVWDETLAGHATAGSAGKSQSDVETSIGVAGAGLTNQPWNSAWDIEVESEVTDALVAYNAVATTDLPTNFADMAITVTTGEVTVGTNNDKTGYSISGTLTTLDALDTAQDTQHATTQGLVSGLNDPSTTQIADAVWDEPISGHTTSGTFGEWVQKKLLTVSKFIGLN